VSWVFIASATAELTLMETRFPAQEHVGGDCKIPSFLYYDQQGAVKAVGAEAMREDIAAQRDDEEWIKAPW
jgi:hypothetical protein